MLLLVKRWALSLIAAVLVLFLLNLFIGCFGVTVSTIFCRTT